MDFLPANVRRDLPHGVDQQLSEAHIAERAYAKWLARGKPDGTQLQDWLEAESELRQLNHRIETAHTKIAESDGHRSIVGARPSESEAFWRTLVQTTTDYITVVESDGIIRFVNHLPAGVLPEDIIGSTVYQHLTGDSRTRFQQTLEEVFRTGQPAVLEVAVILPRVEELHWYAVRMGPVKIDGQVAQVTCVSTDTTAKKRAEQLVAAEHAVTRVLSESQELTDAGDRIVQTICDNLGWDVGAIWIVDAPAQVLRCSNVGHRPGRAAPGFEQLCREHTFAKGIGLPGRIWASERSEWSPDVTHDANFPRAPMAIKDGLRAACGFPIRDGAEFLGVIEFFSRTVQEPDHEMLETMTSIGGQISQFIERRKAERQLRDREKEFALARYIQQGLLPRDMPDLPGFAFGGAARFSQETGGDYYDFLPLAGDGFGIAIADASGHGIAAALVVAETRGSLRTLALTHRSPAKILRLINRRLCEDLPDGHFVTLFLARLNPADRSLVYCSAGHCPGYVLDRDGEVRVKLKSTNVPLGVEPAVEFGSAPRVMLQPGDLVLLYTDGAVEAMPPAGRPFGVQRVLDVVQAHRHEAPTEICEQLLAAVEEYSRPRALLDDVAVAIIKVDADAPDRHP